MCSDPLYTSCTRLSGIMGNLSHDSINRFLNRERFNGQDLFNRLMTQHLINLIASIASNINQLAKAANSSLLPVNDEVVQSLHDAVAAIRWMRDTLIEGMGLKPQSQEPPPKPFEDKSDDP